MNYLRVAHALDLDPTAYIEFEYDGLDFTLYPERSHIRAKWDAVKGIRKPSKGWSSEVLYTRHGGKDRTLSGFLFNSEAAFRQHLAVWLTHGFDQDIDAHRAEAVIANAKVRLRVTTFVAAPVVSAA